MQTVVSSVAFGCGIGFCVLMYNMLATRLTKLKAESRGLQQNVNNFNAIGPLSRLY